MRLALPWLALILFIGGMFTLVYLRDDSEDWPRIMALEEEVQVLQDGLWQLREQVCRLDDDCEWIELSVPETLSPVTKYHTQDDPR